MALSPTGRPAKAPRSSNAYRIMLVDDSAVIRGLFTRALEQDPDIEIVSSVGDGQMAVNALKRGGIDVIVLDIEMPRMDGITALPLLLEIEPDVAIVMASTLTARNADISIKALELGAKDYLTKPSSSRELTGQADFNTALLERVKTFGAQHRRKRREPLPDATKTAAAGSTERSARPTFSAERRASATPATVARDTSSRFRSTERPRPAAAPAPAAGAAPSLRKAGTGMPDIIAIGSSTGGPQALFKVLGDLSKSIRQPIVITQHMPATFTTILAEHITRSTGWPCDEAKDGEPLQSGRVYVAPGDFHLTVVGDGGTRKIRLTQDPPENFCRPAVDPMLRSLAKTYGGKVLTVILTGMGHDGRGGADVVVKAGGTVVAQDEASSVVWGMPGAVANAGLCSAILPLSEIGNHIGRLASRSAA